MTEAGRQDLLRWLTDPGADPPFRSAGLAAHLPARRDAPDQARAVPQEAFAHHADAELARYQTMRDTIPWRESDDGLLRQGGVGVRYPPEAMEADWARWLLEETHRRSAD